MAAGTGQPDTSNGLERAGHRRPPSPPRGLRLVRFVELSAIALLLAGSGLVALVASVHLTTAATKAVAAGDTAMVEHLLAGLGPVAELGDGPMEQDRITDTMDALGALGLAVMDRAGDRVLAAGITPPARGGEGDTAAADLVRTDAGWRLVEVFPVLDGSQVAARVVVVRDGTHVQMAIEAIQRDVAMTAGTAALVLAAVLFLVFRGAQAGIDRQALILVEAQRRDPLTGALTYGASANLLADALAAIEERPVAVALVDIDNFRRLNEVHGSDAGDAALRTVLQELTAVPPSDGTSVGRSGPDEFIVVAPDLDARSLADWLRQVQERLAGAALVVAGAEPLPIEYAAGVAVAPLQGRSAIELLSVASLALDEARSSGGGAVFIGRQSYRDLAMDRQGPAGLLGGLIEAIDRRDRYTRRHCEDVARYALYLATRLGADAELREAIHTASLLHDVGKIGVPDDVLRKPAPLTAAEAELMHQHVVLGGLLVRDVTDDDLVAAGVEYHHERWDGEGYAIGLGGEAIPLIARIVAVADAFSAMTTSRPYRAALDHVEALKRLREVAGSQLDPHLADLFVQSMIDDPEAPRPSDARKPSFWLPNTEAA